MCQWRWCRWRSWKACWKTPATGTVVTSRYFLQPVEELAKKHSVRAVAVDLNDFRQELTMLKELRPGSCVGLVSISPGILRAAEVILHSMRGNELLVCLLYTSPSPRD